LDLIVGEEIALKRNPFCRDTYVDKRITIDLVEEIYPSKYNYNNTEEIGTQEETHNSHCDGQGCCNSIPLFSFFDAAFKCPREEFHSLKIIKYKIHDEPTRP
jgi:hypothetical protein